MSSMMTATGPRVSKSCKAGRLAWYRMENRPKAVSHGPKWGKNGPKMAEKRDFGSHFYKE